MKLSKIAAVFALSVFGFTGQVTAGEHGSEESGIKFCFDLKGGYENLRANASGTGITKKVRRVLRKGAGAWGIRSRLNIESASGVLAGLGVEGRLGGFLYSHQDLGGKLGSFDWGASAGWNIGRYFGDIVTLRPMIGYEARYTYVLKGTLLGLDGGVNLAGHRLGLRGGLHFTRGTAGYNIAARYGFKLFSWLGLGAEVGYRYYNLKVNDSDIKIRGRMRHYYVLGGLNLRF